MTLIGQTVSHYRIAEPFVAAGNGEAYLAEDVRLGRPVVLQLLPRGLASTPAAQGDLGREIQSLASSSHPNATVILDMGSERGRSFVVVEPRYAESFLPLLNDFEEKRADPATRTAALSPGFPQKSPAIDGSSDSSFSPGQILGDRYRMVSCLGRGGMGEVWKTFDLKLQVEVALKSLRPERFAGEGALELLRSEVRTARQVMSPNVCRIFDLIVEEGQELVSMEYIDGQTLTEVLSGRGPLSLSEASSMASQLLAGLAAIHEAGLVHRDVKPENIMITRSGRVVVMDFGIAKGVREDRRGTVSGTPAYMAPEQLRGEALDARADIFSAGVVLLEMLSPEGIGKQVTRERIWQGVRESPPRLPEGPWRAVLERAVASDRERRYGSAGALARALEEVALRVEGAEDKRPYPGLASFTTADAEFFYGREAEVEAVWKKLQRANLLAIVGASGAGKTSFLQAGLVPAMPEGWHHVLCHPGAAPFVSLGEALATELSGDFEALRSLLRFDDPDVAVSMLARWRQRQEHGLLIVDQFEELFTQNPPEVQARFTDLLGRLAAEADVHVLLSMRDDFFLRCHEFSPLAAVFSELTPLGPPTGAALRRALVQPALVCGYRFEDESLVEEMLQQIGEERGALPLLAFAVSRLWEKRNRETGTLQRQAYEEIGGMGGALAQHAEATMERIGTARQQLVREIFRNLVTSEGTRSSMEIESLCSVFAPGDQGAAREVLQRLVEARLLTSFELRPPGEEGAEPRRQVEIVHESLLTSWPRLLRWRTQDADSAQLRDQLRQAAHLWRERGESKDLLWTGTAFQEFKIWRERYPGGLTAAEEAFATAMTRRAEQQRRRRRRLTFAAFAILLVTLGTIGSFWRLSEVRRKKAEASKLHSLGQLELENSPSSALAYAIASLELADDAEVRLFAIKALWRGPTALVFDKTRASDTVDFSPDGKWLAIARNPGMIKVWSSEGREPISLGDTMLASTLGYGYPRFDAGSSFVTGFFRAHDNSNLRFDGAFRVWALADREVTKALPFDGATIAYLSPFRRHLMTLTNESHSVTATMLRVWEFDPYEPKLIGQIALDSDRALDGVSATTSLSATDPTGTWIAFAEGKDLKIAKLATMEMEGPRLIGRYEGDIEAVAFHPDGRRVAALSKQALKVWARDTVQPHLLQEMKGRKDFGFGLHIDPTGKWMAVPLPNGRTQLWDFEGPPGQKPLEVRLNSSQVEGVGFHPNGQWLVTASEPPTFWPLSSRYPKEVQGSSPVFAPDGSWVASIAGDSIQLTSLSPKHPDRSLPSGSTTPFKWGLHVDPKMRFIIYRDYNGLRRVSLGDGSIEELPFGKGACSGAIDPNGRYIAAGYVDDPGGTESRIDVLDLENGKVKTFELGQGNVTCVEFTPTGDLLAAMGRKVVRWNLHDSTHEILLEGVRRFDLSRDGRRFLGISQRRAVLHDLESGKTVTLSSHGTFVTEVAFDVTESLAITGDGRGVVRVGPVTGEEPHLLLGHDGPIARAPMVWMLAVGPQGRWIATAAEEDETRILLWPLPKGSPIYGLPHDEFLSLLKKLTNLRVVPSEQSSTGYAIQLAEFPGWETVPTW